MFLKKYHTTGLCPQLTCTVQTLDESCGCRGGGKHSGTAVADSHTVNLTSFQKVMKLVRQQLTTGEEVLS